MDINHNPERTAKENVDLHRYAKDNLDSYNDSSISRKKSHVFLRLALMWEKEAMQAHDYLLWQIEEGH